MNEAQTRFNKIDPKLRDAGWGIITRGQSPCDMNKGNEETICRHNENAAKPRRRRLLCRGFRRSCGTAC